jgi:hypothetical protein
MEESCQLCHLGKRVQYALSRRLDGKIGVVTSIQLDYTVRSDVFSVVDIHVEASLVKTGIV